MDQHTWLRPTRQYALSLIALGLIGYLSHPEKALTSLIFGSGAGLLLLTITFLFQHARKPVAILLFLYATALSYRSISLWILLANGLREKTIPAVLMTILSVLGYVTFLKIRR